jgi:molecular chaperone HtpG
MTTGKINVQTENIFPIIKKFLYSDHEIFLRELVSNAVDATQKIRPLTSAGEFTGEAGELFIEIKINKEEKTLTISDRGVGMTADEINKYINQIAFSGAEEFVNKYKDKMDSANIIGHFGLGFYSAFMVASKVEIITRSFRETEPG